MDGTILKLIALVLMTVDHIGQFIPGTPYLLRYIGRLSASIFFFCAVEGYLHTRSRKHYLMRMYLCAQLMTAVNILVPLLMHALGKTEHLELISNNVFLEIFGMLFLIYLVERLPKASWRRLLAAVGYFAYQMFAISLAEHFLSFGSDRILRVVFESVAGVFMNRGGLYVDLVILIFYLFRDSRKKQAIAYVLWCGLYVFFAVLCIPALLNPLIEPALGIRFDKFGTLYQRAFLYEFQWMMIFSVPIWFLYNGKRGKGLKKLFYIYYPSHIALLYVIGCLI